MKQALVLFAHGARDPEWAGPISRVRDAIQVQRSDTRVELAFLEFMAPSLDDCIAALAAEGYERIAVVPMFIAQGGHLKRDVPALIACLRQRFPSLAIELAPAVGETAAVVEAMAGAALALLA